MKIEKIVTYPIKALRGVELDSAEVTRHGFPHDRRFLCMQVFRNGTYKNIHIADWPESALFHPSLDLARGLVLVTHKPLDGKEKSISFPLQPDTKDLETIDVEMHGSPTKAYRMPSEYCAWFSSCYGFETILVYLGTNFRPVLMSTQPSSSSSSWLSTATTYLLGTKPETITFADCAPYLITSTTSLLSMSLDPESDMQKFRPNIIISGADEAWEEDYWAELHLPSSDIRFHCVHNCGRCKSINIDYSTGKRDGQILKQMMGSRRVDKGFKYSPIFGRYSTLAPGSEGKTIRVGDEVEVTRRLKQRSVFDWPGLATT